MRIGIFGGSFNPPHYGHLELAKACISHGLEKIIFVPSGNPPHKVEALAFPEQRYRMTALGIKGENNFEACDLELKKSSSSFTYETINDFLNIYPDSELFFIMGADSISEIKTWQNWKELMNICKILVGRRPGYNLTHLTQEIRSKIVPIENPPVSISSSQIRERIRTGKPITHLVPPEVEKYISMHKIYLSK